MPDKIVILKMIDGNEVIAKDIGHGMYGKCRVFQISQNGQTGLVPFVMLSPDAECPINQDLIVTKVPCPYEVEKPYLEAVSGIVLS